MSDDAEQAKPQRTVFREPEAVIVYPEAFQKPPPAQPVRRRSTRAQARTPAPRPKIDYSISRTPQLEVQFRSALAAALASGIQGIGGCMNMWDEKSENGDYYRRDGNLRLNGKDFEVSLYSLSRPPAPDERDEEFKQFRIQQGVGRITNGNGHRFDIFAPTRYGVAQLDDYAAWTVVNRTHDNRIIKRTFLDFLRDPAIEPGKDDAAKAEAQGGFSFGSLKLPRDKRNLTVVPPAPAESPPEPKKVKSKVARKVAKKGSKAKAKKKIVKAARSKPKRRNPPRGASKPKRKPR